MEGVVLSSSLVSLKSISAQIKLCTRALLETYRDPHDLASLWKGAQRAPRGPGRQGWVS